MLTVQNSFSDDAMSHRMLPIFYFGKDLADCKGLLRLFKIVSQTTEEAERATIIF